MARLSSPWIEQLNRTRDVVALDRDLSTDVAVVGAGIAGVSTAYFLLTRTDRRVVLIEADRVAHGATGHNAGQLVSYFERPFHEIAEEFGLEMAAAGQRHVESAWELIEEIRRELGLRTPCLVFTGYAGCADLSELVVRLRDQEKKREAGLSSETLVVSREFARRAKIPARYRPFYRLVSRTELSERLQTDEDRYVAALAGQKGCMNSARFSEEALVALLARYSHRLSVFERTPVGTVRLFRDRAELEAGNHLVRAGRVVLCTNGFERLRVENMAGADIDAKFHHLVRGSVGYMAAFLEAPPAAPAAISYLPSRRSGAAGAYDSDPYFYLTRRPYGEDAARDLVCVGGPEALMDDTNGYSREHPYPDEARNMIRNFVRRTYRHGGRRLVYSHLWHGLMGYTPNGLRCVGAEPCNPVLLYNLGCNGVGILPSVYGGLRISQIVAGEPLSPSIFDPADQRCALPDSRRPPDSGVAYAVLAVACAVFVAAALALFGYLAR